MSKWEKEKYGDGGTEEEDGEGIGAHNEEEMSKLSHQGL
jgi:hypothetical protein